MNFFIIYIKIKIFFLNLVVKKIFFSKKRAKNKKNFFFSKKRAKNKKNFFFNNFFNFLIY